MPCETGEVFALSDPDNARLLLLAAAGLAALGVLLTVVTVLWWRTTRQEHPVLGPLATMGERAWVRADAPRQAELLDEARPSAPGDDSRG